MNLVCGSGRCGSSLVMQMLDAGGVSVVGSGPYYEPVETIWHDFNADWLSQQTGVVKLLYPIPAVAKFNPGDYRVIWLTRDKDQQAKSFLKFAMHMRKIPKEDQDVKAIAKDMIEEERVCLNALEKLGRLMILSFEHIITEPCEAAGKILDFFQVDGDVERMITEVHKRDTLSLPDMTLEDNLIETKAASAL